MALIKDIYSRKFIRRIATSFSHVLPNFQANEFERNIFCDEFYEMEWKARVKHITRILSTFMPPSFPSAAQRLEDIVAQLRKDAFKDGMLEFAFLPDYVESYGINYFSHSMKALETITPFITCEFAIRPFIIEDKQRTLDQMHAWSLHPNPHIRRLSSEGCRPRLPWAMALPELKDDPTPILPIIENLKSDPNEVVRRSVANNLNDISKDNPDVVINIAKKWKGQNDHTDAIVKHACRTLLKQAHPEILELYELSSENIAITDFHIRTPEIRIGDYLEFGFNITNNDIKPRAVRLEYGVYYLKANGLQSRKVFKISERKLSCDQILEVSRRQSFKPITTRKFYPGSHKLSIIVNGAETHTIPFELRAQK